MNCERFEELITDYLDGQLPETERESFEAHRAECGECPELLLQVEQVISLCRAFPEAEPPVRLAERILSATLGERRKVSLRSYFDLSGLSRRFNPQFAFGLGLVLCLIGLVVRVSMPEQPGEAAFPQSVLSRLDLYTHKIYSQGVRLYNAKNELSAEFDYLKTSLFNRIDYHLSQISGQLKEQPEKTPAPPAEDKPRPKEPKKSSLNLFLG